MTDAMRPKCDYCAQPGIALVGESNETVVCWSHVPNGLGDVAQARDEADVAEFQYNALEMARKADQAERRAEEAEFHVEQLRDARDAAERRIERAERLIDSWEHDAPDHSNPVFIGRLRECLRSDPAPVRLRNDDGPAPDPDPIRCATRCSQWPTCRHDWSPWRCQVCEAVVTEGPYCEDHSADEDTGPVVVEEIDWSRPCPAPLRCADQEHCPPACRRVGNREGNKAGSAREDGGCPGCECGEHQWLDRPESDTRECLICGTEVAG